MLAADASHVVPYGAVASVPTSVPSTRNSTWVTPTLSEAVAATGTDPDTVAPLAGEVTDTVGAVVSGTVTVTPALVVLPAASYARAWMVWLPGVAPVAFHVARVGRGGVGAHQRTVDPELDLGHAHVVGGGGGQGTDPETVAPLAGM